MNTPIKNLSIEELSETVASLGLPTFRSKQLLSWLYEKWVNDYTQMTNIPKAVREQLSIAYPLFIPEEVSVQTSIDGSRKYLLKLHDGALIETVGMPNNDGRLTVCVSSQSGCSMRCAFCATGMNGLTRNLFPGEIADQVLLVQNDFNQRVSNVVVMGQGEPFANYDNTLAGLRIINRPSLLNIGARHITVSTCGVISGIEKLSKENEQFTLAVSLHAARQQVRDTIMPAMKSQPVTKLKASLQEYTESTGRRFSFEYALMKGVNDSNEDLAALLDLCKNLLCHVNLIPLNDIESSSYKPVSKSTMKHWHDSITAGGIECSIRNSRGSDIDAACGQLANRYK